MPSLFITPGPTWVQLPLGWVITRTGGMNALFLLLRSGTSISLGILLILSTPWNTILKALGVLHLPDVVLLILSMTYRYIHLLLHMTHDMFLSRKSRIIKPLPPATERQLMGSTAGVLLSKSLQMSSDVYLAMLSRGYHAYPRTLDNFKIKKFDWIYGISIFIIAFMAIWLAN
ncbi:MAG: energy-coupling factor transporter transmembrane protein EcfT [Anaerolineae bacterium]|nr:energy-coupling factor transporter transmembrane protein EcfT [Anaerolineae bacterium]